MSATAFYTAGPLLNLVAELLRRKEKNELSLGELSDRDRVAVAREIKMLKVTVGVQERNIIDEVPERFLRRTRSRDSSATPPL